MSGDVKVVISGSPKRLLPAHNSGQDSDVFLMLYSAVRIASDQASFQKLSEAAEAGNNMASAYLANLLHDAEKFRNSIRAAELARSLMSWLKLECNADSRHAQFNLGRILGHGVGCIVDSEAADKLYRRSAELGHSISQHNMGNSYRIGRAVQVDMKKSVEYYQLSAAQGFPLAQIQLGEYYSDGTGVVKNLTESLRYFKLAAIQGSGIALFTVGLYLYYGFGTATNISEAWATLHQAVSRGNQNAKQLLEQFSRDYPVEYAREDYWRRRKLGLWLSLRPPSEKNLISNMSIDVAKVVLLFM